MGKSRLTPRSTAYWRQMKFCMLDQSRFVKNKHVLWDPYDDDDDDEVSIFDPCVDQDDGIIQDDESTCPIKLRVGKMVKEEIYKGKAKIRGSKGEQRGTHFPKKSGTRSASKDKSRVHGRKVAQRCIYPPEEDNSSFDGTTFSSHLTKHMAFQSFPLLVEALEDKRAPTKLKALFELIDTFERSVLQEELENMCITIFYRCLDSVTAKSAYESYLAARVIGLLAITVGPGSNSHVMMRDSIPKLLQPRDKSSEFRYLSALDCFAITTFFGANDEDDVEKSMRIIWKIFHPISSLKSGLLECSAAILAKAISAWAFLLTTINIWRINPELWTESLSLFFILLEYDDCWVRIAAAEAVAVIFDTTKEYKFMRERDVGKTEIISKIKKLIRETKGTPRKDLNNMREILETILEFLETVNYREESIKIPNKRYPLKVSTVAQATQMKFFKRFLGWSGFLKHMQDNEVLQDVLDYELETREIEFKLKPKMIPTLKAHKQRVQSRHKHRMLVEESHSGFGHFDVTCEE